MHIIIDGYNFIRQTDLRRFEAVSLESGRRELIRRLALYRKKRKHKITVVFDGVLGGSFSGERDRAAGIAIIYSRQGQTADEVIKKAFRDSSEDLLVVTSDREISAAAERQGHAAVTSPAFARKLSEAEFSFPGGGGDMDKDEDYAPLKHKKGPNRRLPKRKRVDEKTLKKL